MWDLHTAQYIVRKSIHVARVYTCLKVVMTNEILGKGLEKMANVRFGSRTMEMFTKNTKKLKKNCSAHFHFGSISPVNSAGVKGNRKCVLFKMAAKLKDKRTSITTVRVQCSAFVHLSSFQPPYFSVVLTLICVIIGQQVRMGFYDKMLQVE